jgi:hypothetical protein
MNEREIQKRHLQSKTPAALAKHLDECRAAAGRIRDLAIASNSHEVKTAVKTLESRLAVVRASYSVIDISQPAHTVAAMLASQQGREKEILEQLNLWRDVKERKKLLDEEISMCEEIISEKNSQHQL